MKGLKIKSTQAKKLHIANSSIELTEVFVRLSISLFPNVDVTSFTPLVYENESKFDEGVKNTLHTDLEFAGTQGVNGKVVQLATEQLGNREHGTYAVAKEYFEGLGYEVHVVNM